jgi:hypothetical protein
MYFVAFIIEHRRYAVVPTNWIQNLNFARIVNYFPNKSLQYNCYFGGEENAWIDGVPNPCFIPNFDEPQNNREYFNILLVKYYGKRTT